MTSTLVAETEQMASTRPWRAGALIATIPETLGALTMLAITLVLFAGVVWRYFFVDPLTWSDEIARLLFAWLAFLGAAIGVKRGAHSAVAVFEVRMPLRWQRLMVLLALVATALMACVLVYTGTRETIANFSQVMAVTRLSRGWQYLSVPVSGALMLVYLVPLTRRAWRGELRIASHVPDGE